LNPPYIVGVTIDDGYYYCSEVLVPNNNDKTIEDTIKDKIHEIMDNLGYGEIDTFNVTYSGENKSSDVNIFQLEYNETKGEYSGVICNWGERDYNIKVFYSCEKIEDWSTNNGKPYLKYYDFYAGESVESSMDDYGMWIHDEETELNTFDKVLTVQQYAYDYDNDNNSNTEAVKMRREYLIFEKDEFKHLSPIDEIKLKRSLIHGYSIHEDRYGSNIKVGVKNGTPPYNETIKGNVEEGRVYDIFLGDWGDTSLSNILLPTESWMTDYGTEFNGIVETKYTKKKEYEYNVLDGDEFSAIYGKTMSNKVYIWNEVDEVYELIKDGSKLEYGVIPQSAAESK
jgi:hypothetical protein